MLPYLPFWGGGAMRSRVAGHASCFLSFIRNAAPPVPLHHLRWSPSPFRGGSSTSGRNQPSFLSPPPHPDTPPHHHQHPSRPRTEKPTQGQPTTIHNTHTQTKQQQHHNPNDTPHTPPPQPTQNHCNKHPTYTHKRQQTKQK